MNGHWLGYTDSTAMGGDEQDRGDGTPEPGMDRYQELFERSADANLIIEGETFVDCNRAAVEMLRCHDRNDVLQTHPSELSPEFQPDGRSSFEKANEMMSLARERGSHRFVWQHVRRDGEVFPVEVLLTFVEKGTTPVIHVVWRDLSERWQLEEQLRQSQKMDAIGKLAGGIAHDFNNLLVAVFGNCTLLERLRLAPEAEGPIREIRQASERAAALVKQLMSFSRGKAPIPIRLQLDAALEELMPLAQRMVGEDIEVAIRCAPDACVMVDPSQFDQIILNLLSNARDAMPKGGRVAIEVTRQRASPGDLPLGDYAHVQVRDGGTGMDAETLRRAFEPFYTSKPLGEGTGFGLSTVYGIIVQNGGHAHIESQLGAGTTVHFYLPLAEDEQPVESESTSLSTPPPGTERVMVVEDDPAIASLVELNLRELGYEVSVAHDGLEGLEVAAREGIRGFDLILSDVRMPRLGGAAMVQRLRELGHEFRILFMSGHIAGELSILGDEDVDLLHKPFTPEELARRVRRCLDEQ